MDRLGGILRNEWTAYWRRFSRARNLTVGHQGITAVITVLILTKYVRLLGVSSAELARGNTTPVESLLVIVFIVWLFLPGISRASISLDRLLHLPLSFKDLFAIRVISLLITPYSWIVVAGSFAILYPLAHAPRPWAATASALLFVTMSCTTGLAIAHLLSVAAWRRWLFLVLVLLCAAVAYVVGVNQTAGMMRFLSILPTGLVTRAMVARNPMLPIGALLVLNVLTLAAAWWSFQQSLESAHRTRPWKRMDSLLFGLPGATAGLSAKDFRYFRSLLDPYFGVLATVLFCFYLTVSAAPSEWVVWVSIIIVFIPNASLAFNSFGLDTRSGLDRYALLPVRGLTIMRAKNLAFVMIVGVQVFPIMVWGCWRFGLATGVFGLLEALSLAAAYLAWGNWMTITHPTKMHFFRFAPPGGSIPEIIAGIVFGSLPGLLIVYLLGTRNDRAIWVALLVVLVCGGLYFLALIRSGKRFDENPEILVRSLS